MARVVIGRAGTTVHVDTGVCAKTGRLATQQVTIRGATTHDRWRCRNRLAWLVGGGGFALGVANALIDNVGVPQNRAGELVLTRVHQAAVDAIADAKVSLD